ncbi:MAG: hypothetical protein HONBIEJF_01649 [Fimbriimonadaceae bacterium]|nr:hypothetical protein [Fimbriimonadaceae bacterium]
MNKIAIFAVLAAIMLPAVARNVDSGLKVGEKVFAFHPKHVAGPHKGTDACPPCTYGNLPQVQVWINGDGVENYGPIAKLLQNAMEAHKDQKLKAFMIVMVEPGKASQIAGGLEHTAAKLGLKDVAVAYLPTNDEAVSNYQVNTSKDVKNTIFVYRDRTVKSKFVNLKSDASGLGDLKKAIAGIVN